MTITSDSFSRRNFLKGLAFAGAGAAALGLTACGGESSTQKESDTAASTSDSPTKPASYDARETFDCDICVIGAGASGLAASVEAASQGAKVICLESQAVTGGNINGVEGCFGIGSAMQFERNIEIDPGEIIKSELLASQMRASGPGYVDMVHRSGDNIDWLVENGVKFGGVDVDKGDIEVFHRFESGQGLKDYAVPMTAKAEDLGVDIKLKTAAHTLVKGSDGAITGVYADDDEGTILVNAKAVIVATGGFAENKELLSQITENQWINYGGFEGHDGSGHLMCVDAGARSYLDSSALLIAFAVDGTPGYYEGGMFAFLLGVAAPYAVWINQNGERFAPEDCAAGNAMEMCNPVLQQEVAWCVMDSSMMDIYSNGNDALYEQIDEGIKYGSIVKADTLKDLAKAADLPEDTFLATMEEYEGFVKDGSDKNYGKDKAALLPFNTAPYYALRISNVLNSTIGSIYTDRSFHALDETMKPIKGLYVVGVEGAMLWSNLYTINVSGGCNANNVNSGRTAAQDALTTIA